MRMAWLVRTVWLATGLVLAGCEGSPGAPVSGSSSSTSVAVAEAPTKLQVTVPGLGGATPAVDPPSASSLELTTPPDPVAASSVSSGVGTTDAEDGVASEASPVAPTPPAGAAPATVDVELVGCADCQVLGTHANVVAGYSAALIGQGGRAAVISVDAAGAVGKIQAVPYGVTFAAQPGGELACGAGGRCLVLATEGDGRAVLSAYALGTDGSWTDLSGSDGFVSATDKALPVALEDALGAAVQVTDGTVTIWNVLAWNGSAFATIGCGPDGDTPDLATLDLAACLS